MAGIVEKVSAQVVYEFPTDKNDHRKRPVSVLTIKQFEEFLFNARMRGAEDNTTCDVLSKPYWDGYSHTNQPYALSINVNATMDGMPVITPEPASPAAKNSFINTTTLSTLISLVFSFGLMILLHSLGLF